MVIAAAPQVYDTCIQQARVYSFAGSCKDGDFMVTMQAYDTVPGPKQSIKDLCFCVCRHVCNPSEAPGKVSQGCSAVLRDTQLTSGIQTMPVTYQICAFYGGHTGRRQRIFSHEPCHRPKTLRHRETTASLLCNHICIAAINRLFRTSLEVAHPLSQVRPARCPHMLVHAVKRTQNIFHRQYSDLICASGSSLHKASHQHTPGACSLPLPTS